MLADGQLASVFVFVPEVRNLLVYSQFDQGGLPLVRMSGHHPLLEGRLVHGRVCRATVPHYSLVICILEQR